jgi:hypothetical protein
LRAPGRVRTSLRVSDSETDASASRGSPSPACEVVARPCACGTPCRIPFITHSVRELNPPSTAQLGVSSTALPSPHHLGADGAAPVREVAPDLDRAATVAFGGVCLTLPDEDLNPGHRTRESPATQPHAVWRDRGIGGARIPLDRRKPPCVSAAWPLGGMSRPVRSSSRGLPSTDALPAHTGMTWLFWPWRVPLPRRAVPSQVRERVDARRTCYADFKSCPVRPVRRGPCLTTPNASRRHVACQV